MGFSSVSYQSEALSYFYLAKHILLLLTVAAPCCCYLGTTELRQSAFCPVKLSDINAVAYISLNPIKVYDPPR